MLSLGTRYLQVYLFSWHKNSEFFRMTVEHDALRTAGEINLKSSTGIFIFQVSSPGGNALVIDKL